MSSLSSSPVLVLVLVAPSPLLSSLSSPSLVSALVVVPLVFVIVALVSLVVSTRPHPTPSRLLVSRRNSSSLVSTLSHPSYLLAEEPLDLPDRPSVQPRAHPESHPPCTQTDHPRPQQEVALHRLQSRWFVSKSGANIFKRTVCLCTLKGPMWIE